MNMAQDMNSPVATEEAAAAKMMDAAMDATMMHDSMMGSNKRNMMDASMMAHPMEDGSMMDDAMMAKDNMKRHLMMPASMMSEDSASMMAKDSMTKRSMNHPDPSEMVDAPNDLASTTLPNNWYGKYE